MRPYKLVKAMLISMLILVSLINLVGCIRQSSGGEIRELSFRDAVSFNEIKKLDGKVVSIVGFMSTTSPLDGTYFYLQNMPYQSCPFCLPNTTRLLNTIAVYAPRGESFKFLDVPIKVTGKIEVKDITDAMGYSYNYRIIDAKIERAEVLGLGREIRIYTDLVDRGFVSLFTTAVEEIYKTINYEKFNMTSDDVKPLDMIHLDRIKDTFKGLNPQDYIDIIQVVDSLEGLVKKANELIESENTEELVKLNGELVTIFNSFYDWLMKPEI